MDKFLNSMGFTRKDFRIEFNFRGKRRYLETFKLGWWIASALIVAFWMSLFYVWYLLMFAITI